MIRMEIASMGHLSMFRMIETTLNRCDQITRLFPVACMLLRYRQPVRGKRTQLELLWRVKQEHKAEAGPPRFETGYERIPQVRCQLEEEKYYLVRYQAMKMLQCAEFAHAFTQPVGRTQLCRCVQCPHSSS